MARIVQQSRPTAAYATLIAALARPALLVVALTAVGYTLGGPVASRAGIDSQALQATAFALYFAAIAYAFAHAIPLVRKHGPWPGATSVALQGISASLVLFALLRALPDLATASIPLPAVESVVGFFSPYLLPLRALSIAVLIGGATLSLYRASFPIWRPVAVRAAVQAFVVSIAVWCLLEPNGPVTLRTGLDLGFYSSPVWSAAAGYASFWLIRLGRVSRRSHMVAALVLWTSLTVAGYLTFHFLNHLAVELTLSERYEHTGNQAMPYLSVAAGVDRWMAAGVAILGLERSTSGYTARWNRRSLGPLFEASRSLALGVIVWGAAQQMVPVGSPAQIAGVVGFSALAAVAAGQIARSLMRWSMPAVAASVVAWLSGSPFRNANIGGLIALYATVVRPAVYEATAYAPLIEWLGLTLPVAYLIARAAGSIGEHAPLPPAPPAWREWRLHRQNANPVPDRALTRVGAIREGFVETGEVSVLAVRIATAMTAAARTVDDIVTAVSPLVEMPQAADGRPWAVWRLLAGGPGINRARVERKLAAERMERAIASAAARAAPRPASATSDVDEALWAEAKQAFVERGDRIRLAVAVAMLGWRSGMTRDVLTTQFGRIVQYRDARPRWYALPSMRRRTAAMTPAARTGFADQLRAAARATGVPR